MKKEARDSSPQSTLEPGTPAPDFTLHSSPDQTFSLRDFRGQPMILVFYPADWSPACGDQVALYNEILPEFRHYNAELFGISVDGIGVIKPSPKKAICSSRCSPILNPKARWRAPTVSIVKETASAIALYSWLTARE